MTAVLIPSDVVTLLRTPGRSTQDQSGWMTSPWSWSADTADVAVQRAGVATSILLDTLEEHAMTPNLQKGKNSPPFGLERQRLQTQENPVLWPQQSGHHDGRWGT